MKSWILVWGRDGFKRKQTKVVDDKEHLPIIVEIEHLKFERPSSMGRIVLNLRFGHNVLKID